MILKFLNKTTSIMLNMKYLVIFVLLIIIIPLAQSSDENFIKVCSLKELQAARSRICLFYKRADRTQELLAPKKYASKSEWKIFDNSNLTMRQITYSQDQYQIWLLLAVWKVVKNLCWSLVAEQAYHYVHQYQMKSSMEIVSSDSTNLVTISKSPSICHILFEKWFLIVCLLRIIFLISFDGYSVTSFYYLLFH